MLLDHEMELSDESRVDARRGSTRHNRSIQDEENETTARLSRRRSAKEDEGGVIVSSETCREKPSQYAANASDTSFDMDL